MLKSMRQDIITTMLDDTEIITIEDAMNSTGGSRSTIIRDFDELDKTGFVTRLRGGIKKIGPQKITISGYTKEPDYNSKLESNREEKRRIAKFALNYINANDTIFLGDGTSTFELARELVDKRPVFITTNDIHIAYLVSSHKNVNLTLLGGSVRYGAYSSYGYLTEMMLNNIHCDSCFLSVDGISNCEVTNYSAQEVAGKQTMLRNSNFKCILADHSKFETTAFVSVCSLKYIDLLITGKEIDDKYIDMFEQNDIKYVVV